MEVFILFPKVHTFWNVPCSSTHILMMWHQFQNRKLCYKAITATCHTLIKKKHTSTCCGLHPLMLQFGQILACMQGVYIKITPNKYIFCILLAVCNSSLLSVTRNMLHVTWNVLQFQEHQKLYKCSKITLKYIHGIKD